VGAYFLEQLREIADEFPIVGDVRGLGLMLGVEMSRIARRKSHWLGRVGVSPSSVYGRGC